ncbi:MAG: M20/M25/M40 family metallo-hydrolase [Deltaproteobacteria bacterium]|nr:M20/M25/M40 family metallo-hydrolase [Deltaproteobacteria bacterium]
MKLVALVLVGLCACAAQPRSGAGGAPAAEPSRARAIDYDQAAGETRALLAALIAADTSNPPGNEARAVALGGALLRAAGIPYEVTDFAPGRQNLVARLAGDGREPPLLLLAHTDVVSATGQTWATDPHVMTERDGYLIGRGVDDDLGMATVALEVVLLLAREGTPLRRDVILAWTGDEESGGAGIRWLLANRPQTIRAALALNEGGGLVLDDGGRVKFASLQTAEKTYQDFEVTARGPTGHSSVPLAANAIYELAGGLDRLGRHRFPVRLQPVTRAYFGARAAVEEPALARAMRAVASPGAPPRAALAVLDRDPILAASLRTTCVATTLGGGTRRNALPAEATANVNCRILPDESVADVQRTLADVLADPHLEVRATDEFGHAEPSPLDGPGPAALRRVLDAMWPEVPIVPFMSREATDSRFLRAAGVAAYGLSPITTTEADGRRAHGVDERIPVASLRTGVEFLHRLVLDLAADMR